MEYGNQIKKFLFCLFFFLNPRCLLIDLVHWVKRELKTFFKKSSLVLIHLTPFAWRSGQTSSMLGGAQFNATLLTVKHLPAIYNAKMTILVTKLKHGKQQLSGLPVPASLRIKVGRGQHTYTVQEVTHKNEAPELLALPKLVLANIVKRKLTLYTYTAQYCHSREFPHCNVINLCPLLQSLKSFSNFKKGEKSTIRESLSKLTPGMTGFWSFLAPSGRPPSSKDTRDSVAANSEDFWGPFPAQGPHRNLLATVRG